MGSILIFQRLVFTCNLDSLRVFFLFFAFHHLDELASLHHLITFNHLFLSVSILISPAVPPPCLSILYIPSSQVILGLPLSHASVSFSCHFLFEVHYVSTRFPLFLSLNAFAVISTLTLSLRILCLMILFIAILSYFITPAQIFLPSLFYQCILSTAYLPFDVRHDLSRKGNSLKQRKNITILNFKSFYRRMK